MKEMAFNNSVNTAGFWKTHVGRRQNSFINETENCKGMNEWELAHQNIENLFTKQSTSDSK